MRKHVIVVHTGPKVPFKAQEFDSWTEASRFIKLTLDRGVETVQSVSKESRAEICRCCGQPIEDDA